MSRVLQGIVHGRQVELTEDPGVPDGERVEVILRAKPSQQVWGDGIRRSAGAGADAPGFDEAFEEIERERRSAAYRNGSE